MSLRILLIFAVVAGLSACTTGGVKRSAAAAQFSGTGTLVISEIDFAEQAYVREAVRNECRLPGKLTSFIKQYASGLYASIESGSAVKTADAQLLEIEIIDLSGARGGAWSGGKMVMIKGTLRQNGKVIGDFKARRVSGGGMFGGYKGTCSILGRCVKALGKDVAEWLGHPSTGAVLGDL